MFRQRGCRLPSSGGVTSHWSFPVNTRRGVSPRGWIWADGSLGWFCCFLSVEGLIQLTRWGVELRGELRSMSTNHNAAPYCVIRQTLLYLDFSLSLSLSQNRPCSWRGLRSEHEEGDKKCHQTRVNVMEIDFPSWEGLKKIRRLPHRSETHIHTLTEKS